MLIPLICTQCGAKLEVERSQVVEAGDSLIVLAGGTFQCSHCGMKYLPGEKINNSPDRGVISIQGNVTNSNIIIGSATVIDNRPLQGSGGSFGKSDLLSADQDVSHETEE